MSPSGAGAGRGTLSLNDYRRAEAPRPAGWLPRVTDPMGLGGLRPAPGRADIETRERPVSVLQTVGMGAPDMQRRLALGAGPINRETVARADRLLSGEDVGSENLGVVQRAAAGMQGRVTRGEANSFGDLVHRAKSPSAKRLAVETTAGDFRDVGQWATDSVSALLSGVVSIPELATNIVAPSSALASRLGSWQASLQEMESAPMQARRQLLADRVRSEQGFIDQYLATVGQLVTNPSVAVQETLRQAAMFGGVLASARGGQLLAQGGARLAAGASPAIALSDAITGGAVIARAGQIGATVGGVGAASGMAAGDAAGSAYKALMGAPQRVWDQSEEYRDLIAQGVDPLQAKQEISTAKARLAAVIAAPLGLLGFAGAEASFVGSMASRAGRSPGKVLVTELLTEPAEEALTQVAGNAAVRTVDPAQELGEGAGEAAGMATVTSGPFAGAGAINELRKPPDRSEKIKALRADGDTMAADMLQRRFDREMAAYSASTEAERLRAEFGDALAERYRGIRAAGAKSGDAVVKAAIQASAEQAADQSGLSPKARAALLERLESVPPEKAPQVIQRFVEGMADIGRAQRFDGLETLGQRTETQMEGMLDAVLDDSVRPTMDAIEGMEGAQVGSPTSPDAPVAPDFDAGNDIRVTPETDAVHTAATSPLNDLPEPTDAQKEAGNYRVGRLRMAGMDVSIENPQGSVRRGTSPDGTAWETPMQDHYGYIRRTTAADGDKLDVFIKPGTPPDFDGTVFVVDQVDPATGEFDEAKVVMGAADKAEAEAIYRRNYSEGWQGLGAITAMPMADFKAWAMSDQARLPLAPEGTFQAASGSDISKVTADQATTVGPDVVPGEGDTSYTSPREAARPDQAIPSDPREAAVGGEARTSAGDLQPSTSVLGDTPAPDAEYFSRTVVGTSRPRRIGARRIQSAADAARATAYLFDSAVERLDGIVTDKDGVPLAVVGGFKGATGQASVYPATLMAEAVRIPGAARIWFSHNHPSGKAALSGADMALNRTLSDVFKGSGIEPMGILAVAGDRFAYQGSPDQAPIGQPVEGPIEPSEDGVEVPVIERERGTVQADREAIESPSKALEYAKKAYDGGGPGLILLDMQNRVVAWMPLPVNARSQLRGTGGLATIYRAVSESNAGAAIIVHGGELDHTVNKNGRRVTAAQNIAAALQNIEVRPLDTVNVATGESTAQQGKDVAAGPVYRRDDEKPTPAITADLFRRMTKPVRYGMSPEDLRAAVEPVVQGWSNGPEVVVVDTAGDLPVAAPSDAAGMYLKGTVYLVAARIRTVEQAMKFLGHEAIAHYGLREMLGREGWRSFMADVQLALKTGNKPLQAIQAEVRRAYAEDDGTFNLSPAIEADEIAARVVEQAVGEDGKFRPGFGFVKAVYAKVTEFLRGLGIKVPFTLAELQGALVNAQRFLEVGKRADGARGATQPVWARGDVVRVPQVVIGAGLASASSHPQYTAAKAGDEAAAVEVAQALVTPELVAKVRAEIGDAKPLVVGVISEEATGRNKIPLAGAEVLAQHLGLTTSTDIVQANRARRTNLDGLDRIFAGPEFVGPVVAGQEYVILDDTLTQGATFAALAAHIEAGGGRVRAAIALTGKQYSARIQPSPETIKALRDKHGDLEDTFRSATGYGFDALTESEARYLANFKPAGAVRDRILAEGRRRGEQPDQGNAEGLSSDGPVFARSPTLRAPAPSPAAQPGATAPPSTTTAQPAPAPSFWDTPQDTRGDRIIYELQDGRVDLKRVQQAIEATRGQIDERFDARLAETLYPGRVARRSERFLKDEAQPLLEVMARNNVSMDELSDYLHARHARERNEQVAKVNPGMPDGGAGSNSKGVLMTTAAAKAHLDAVSPMRRVVLDALAARVDAITTGTRQLLVDEGLEQADAIKAWEGAYKAYVPLFRDEAEGGNPHHAGTGISVRGSASRRATGSTKKATNILAHVLMQREAAITRAEKNRVGVALYGLALQAPNPDFWTTIRPGMSDAQITAELQRMGVSVAALGDMSRAPTIRTVDPVLGRVVDRPNPMYKSMPGAIVVKINGSDRVLMLDASDPRGARLAENLKNLDGLTRLDIAGSVVGKATRWLAAVNTQYNPAFGLVNFVRDSIGGAINITSTALRGKTARVLAMTPAAVAGIARELAGKPSGEWGKLWRQFQADGGQTGYREMFKDADARTKAIEAELKSMEKTGKLRGDRVVGAVLGVLDVFNTTLENAVRLAAYREALDSGMSRAEAARLGRELTVDFNRKGRTGREVGPLYAFFNASVQGQARTLQTLAGPAGAKIITGGLLLGVGQALLLLLAGYDDDDIPEFVKSRALIVPLGESDKGEKRYFALPMPLGLHVLPNTGRVLAELTLSGGEDLGAKVFDAVGEIAGSFNPLGGGNIFEADGALRTVAPTVLDPLIELAANKNFAGAPIEREAGENDPRPGHQRARESTMRSATGQTYLEISRILNKLTGGDNYDAGLVSPTPERVRYLLQVLGGGLQREAEKIVNTAVDVSKGDEVKARGVPVFGRFFGEVDDELVQRSRYFDNVREIERAERRLKAAAKAGDAEAAEAIVKEVPTAVLGKTKSATQKGLRDLNEAAMQTLDDREMVETIDHARTERMRVLNETADSVRRAARGPTPGELLRQAVSGEAP